MRHLKALRELKDIETIAIPKRSERLILLEQEGFQVAKNLQEASQKGARFCIIASDTGQHVSDALEALDFSMELLVEKPLSTEASSAVLLCNEGEKKGEKIFVGSVLRFSESLNTFHNLLIKIGPVYSVQIECRSYLPNWRPQRSYRESYSARREEGGVLRDLIHEIDYACWIFGWPKSLQANLRNFGILNIDVEEMAELFWETDKGTAVSICLDYLSEIPRRSMSAFGRKGILEWDGIEGKVTLELLGELKQVIVSKQTRDEMFLKQTEAFVRGEKTLASAKEGLQALGVCDAARLASQQRKETSVVLWI